jgi:hypothetical protein
LTAHIAFHEATNRCLQMLDRMRITAKGVISKVFEVLLRDVCIIIKSINLGTLLESNFQLQHRLTLSFPESKKPELVRISSERINKHLQLLNKYLLVAIRPLT